MHYQPLLQIDSAVMEPRADYETSGFPHGPFARKIHRVRGQYVVLDRDLAELYAVDLAELHEQVVRHAERLIATRMFRITAEEIAALRRVGHRPGDDLPLAFTAAGSLMLACILGSDQAVVTSVRLMELFVRMRQVLIAHQDVLLRMEQLGLRATEEEADIATTFRDMDQLFSPPDHRLQ